MKFKFLVLVSLCVISCTHLPTNTNSGPDQYQEGATEFLLNSKIQDSLNVKGDATDWKYIKIPGKGTIIVEVNFLDDKAVGEVLILGSNGYLQTSYNSRAKNIIKKLVFKGDEGVYFIKVSLTNGKSDYSLRSTFIPDRTSLHLQHEDNCFPF